MLKTTRLATSCQLFKFFQHISFTYLNFSTCFRRQFDFDVISCITSWRHGKFWVQSKNAQNLFSWFSRKLLKFLLPDVRFKAKCTKFNFLRSDQVAAAATSCAQLVAFWFPTSCQLVSNYIVRPVECGLNSIRLAMFKSLSKPDFDKITRSTAVLLLLLIWENGLPSYWNYTSGFDLSYWSSRILAFCFYTPNVKFLILTVPEIWRGAKISKVGHMTSSRPLWPNFAFPSLVPLLMNLHAKIK